MPAAFEKARKAKGARVRTITKGPNKGRLIVFRPGGSAVLGEKRKRRNSGARKLSS